MRWNRFLTLFAAALVESLLFGIHLVLFCICFYLLVTRRNEPSTQHDPSRITLMFALYVETSPYHPDSLCTMSPRRSSCTHIDVSNNLLADGLLIYRCYRVWGGRKYIMLTTAAVPLTHCLFKHVFAFNIVMTDATAGRSWWVARSGRRILGPGPAIQHRHRFYRPHPVVQPQK
ncbi:hypothetical protein LshimejAT787_0902050 [Lyophyllum shimeji]|uniref:Uncharacterized protein n=1 Tax=Lyophyllum shimeji TaxID=47721 RepID=A0A9P3UR69_LYOSH|nr:hypothetical protein LshimejAT787_0902050 [Lyophyllum shimeji]